MTGSTLYRRLPNGSWAAEREDPVPDEVADAGSAAPVVHPAPPPPPPRTSGAQTPRKRRRWGPLRIAKWAIAAYAAWLVFLVVYAAFALDKVPAAPEDQVAQTSGSVWLLVGSDSRAGLTRKQQRELRTGNTEGNRTDTIMLVHQRLGRAPRLVSIPRDSWVTIPEHTAANGETVPARSGKINSSFTFGGAPLLTQTVEYNTGVHVDHYMEIGFAGIVEMTDAVGGIEACFDRAITDARSGLDVEAGCTTLDGAQALAWVRMRYADPKGDLGRIERQQQYMAAMVDEVVSPVTLINPVRQWRLVNAVLDSVVVGEGTGMFNLSSFSLGMARLGTGSGEVTTVPVDESDRWEAGQSVVTWDQAEAEELFASMGGEPPAATQ